MHELAAGDIITNMGVDILYYVDHDLPTLPKLADFSVVPPAPSNIALVRVFVIKVILY